MEHGCSCQKCKCIFLTPKEGSKIAVQLNTYKIGKERYVKYKEKEYLTRDFIEKYADKLEFRIIEMDHLTEAEQKERNLLDNRKFEDKLACVSGLGSERTMRRESRKCQNLCCKCHVEETIRRQKENQKVPYIMTELHRQKKEYVDNLKKECGCSECKLKTDLLRFLEMDHLIRKLKRANISQMVLSPEFSLEDVIEECKKCRVLCRHCHKIHTDEQRKNGEFRRNVSTPIVINNITNVTINYNITVSNINDLNNVVKNDSSTIIKSSLPPPKLKILKL